MNSTYQLWLLLLQVRLRLLEKLLLHGLLLGHHVGEAGRPRHAHARERRTREAHSHAHTRPDANAAHAGDGRRTRDA